MCITLPVEVFSLVSCEYRVLSATTWQGGEIIWKQVQHN